MGAFVLLVVSGISIAQTGTIQGHITEGVNLSLAGANVFLADTQIGTILDNNGNFRFDRVPPGAYEL